MEDNIYEPYKTRRRKRNPDLAEDSTGQVVEYAHGYLKAKAKAARGVFPQRKPRRVPFVPAVVPDCGRNTHLRAVHPDKLEGTAEQLGGMVAREAKGFSSP